MPTISQAKQRVIEVITEKNKASQQTVHCYPDDLSSDIGLAPAKLDELMLQMAREGMLDLNGEGGYFLSKRLEFERLDKISPTDLDPSNTDYLRKAVADAFRWVQEQAANLVGGDASLGYILEGDNAAKFFIMVANKPPKLVGADLTHEIHSLSYDEFVRYLCQVMVEAGVQLK